MSEPRVLRPSEVAEIRKYTYARAQHRLILALCDSYDRLTAAISEVAELARDGMDIDVGVFEDVMVEHGLFVKVPADRQFREEFDVDEMLVLWTEGTLAKDRR